MEKEFCPLFLADWMDVAFVHFRVDPKRLQTLVPFALDLLDGDAYVSIVSFTQRRLRPKIGGRFVELLATPLGQHGFLNLRTYVRHEGTCGIYFLAEWIPNRIAHLIGPRLYGLPYRLGRLDYASDRRLIRSRGRAMDFTIESGAPFQGDGLSDYLVERYSAFTRFEGISRRFDIAHKPWPLSRCDVNIARADLLADAAPCLIDAAPICSYYSIGVQDVMISRPQRVATSPATPARRSPYRLRRIGSAGCP